MVFSSERRFALLCLFPSSSCAKCLLSPLYRNICYLPHSPSGKHLVSKIRRAQVQPDSRPKPLVRTSAAPLCKATGSKSDACELLRARWSDGCRKGTSIGRRRAKEIFESQCRSRSVERVGGDSSIWRDRRHRGRQNRRRRAARPRSRTDFAQVGEREGVGKAGGSGALTDW